MRLGTEGAVPALLADLSRHLVKLVVVVALVAGTAAFVAFDKTVTVSVDGEQRSVRTFGRTVGDVLAAEDLAIGPHDLVAPAPASRLDDGDQVVVRFARPLDITVDNVRRRVWTTATSVDEALVLMGVRADGAFVSVSRSARLPRSGLSLDVRTPREVTVLADGRRLTTTTTAFTVREVLRGLRVPVRPRDRVSPALETFPTDAMVVALTRVDGRFVVRGVPIPFRVVRTADASMYKGDERVQTRGRVGLRVLRYAETFHDRKLVSRKLIGNVVRATPVTKVVRYGTKERPPPPPPSSGGGGSGTGPRPSADGLNWAALADCESGGNPRAYNPSGPYYGLYQFSLPTWRSVGGSGLPSEASSGEQTARAQALYRRSGAGQWPVCGRLLFT